MFIAFHSNTEYHLSKLTFGKVTGLTGHAVKSQGISTVSVKIGPTYCEVDFEVFEGLKKTTLVGSNFLPQRKAQTDFEQHI